LTSCDRKSLLRSNNCPCENKEYLDSRLKTLDNRPFFDQVVWLLSVSLASCPLSKSHLYDI
jgi:hypothetical protein